METDAGDYMIGDGKQQQPLPPPTHKPSTTSTLSFGVPSQLEPFVLLAKSARGAGAAALINQATAAPGVYVFSELLQVPAIKDLAKGDQASSYELLEIFAYGTWGDYLAKKDSLPPLKPAQETKLKQLTVLSLSSENRVIPYSLLLTSLNLPDIPSLEDLLIEAFYSNVLSGRLDQKGSQLEVTSGVGRDVRPDPPSSVDAMEIDALSPSLGTLTTSLQDWLATINILLGSLSHHLAEIHANNVNQITLQREQEKVVREAVGDVQAKLAAKDSAKEGKEGSWTGDVLSGIKGKTMGFFAGKEEMDVDLNASGSARSPQSSTQGRTRKRGRM